MLAETVARVLIAFTFLVLCSWCNVLSAQTSMLRLMTWNLENLGDEPGRSMFPERSRARTERDYASYRKYILSAKPDLIFFQEVGGPRSLERILPSGYNYLIAQQYFGDKRSDPDIFTAIAFQTTKFSLVDVFNVPTAIAYADHGSVRHTRDTIGVRLVYGGVTMWFLSVHMKSSCERKTLIELDAPNNPCFLLRRQLETLAGVLPRLARLSDVVVIGGDFNRRGVPSYEEDAYLGILPNTVNHFRRDILRPGLRRCQTYLDSPKEPIDFFVVYAPKYLDLPSNTALTEITWDERDLQLGYKFSDHCPIVMNWKIPFLLDNGALR